MTIVSAPPTRRNRRAIFVIIIAYERLFEKDGNVA